MTFAHFTALSQFYTGPLTRSGPAEVCTKGALHWEDCHPFEASCECVLSVIASRCVVMAPANESLIAELPGQRPHRQRRHEPPYPR